MNIRPFSWKVLVIAQDPASWLKIMTQKQAQCGENIPRAWNKTENHWWSLGQEYSFQCSAAPYYLSTCEWAVGLVTTFAPLFSAPMANINFSWIKFHWVGTLPHCLLKPVLKVTTTSQLNCISYEIQTMILKWQAEERPYPHSFEGKLARLTTRQGWTMHNSSYIRKRTKVWKDSKKFSFYIAICIMSSKYMEMFLCLQTKQKQKGCPTA